LENSVNSSSLVTFGRRTPIVSENKLTMTLSTVTGWSEKVSPYRIISINRMMPADKTRLLVKFECKRSAEIL